MGIFYNARKIFNMESIRCPGNLGILGEVVLENAF